MVTNMNLTHRELAHVLLGLRTLQELPDGAYEALEDHMLLDGADLMTLEEIDGLCEKLNVDEGPVIYDSLPADDPNGVMDRYTVFPYPGHPDRAMRRTYLGCSLGGRAVSMWGELGPDHVHYDQLGRRVQLSDLDPDTQAHIKRRIKETV